MKNPFVNWKGLRKEAKETLERLHINVDENKMVRQLSPVSYTHLDVYKRQVCASVP